MLQIITNYTPRSHVLCGAALKDVYASFRMEVLRVEEWSTWHSKMAPIPGGKGWCIRKANLDDLVTKLTNYNIPFEIVPYVGPIRMAKQKKQRNQKGPKTAYFFFAKDKWVEAQSRLPEGCRKDIGNTSKELSKMWKEVIAVSKATQWHAKAAEARETFERNKTMNSHEDLPTTSTGLPSTLNPVVIPTLPLPLPFLAPEPDVSTPPLFIPLDAQPRLEDSPEVSVSEKTYKEMWAGYPHDTETFSFGDVDETTGEEYNLCRFMYEKEIPFEAYGKDYEHTLSFRLPKGATKEEMYKRAWELATQHSTNGKIEQ